MERSGHGPRSPAVTEGVPQERLGPLVQAFAFSSIPEGLLAKGLLESEGVPVVVKGEGEGPYRLGPVYLWVPEEFEVKARRLLDEARSTDPEATDPEA